MYQLWWFSTEWIYMILCLFHVNNGCVQCGRLVFIVLYWYGLWHKPCQVYDTFRPSLCLLTTIVRFWLTKWFYRCDKLSKASHGIHLFVYLKFWNLENINVLKTPESFGGRKETEYLSAIVDNGTLRLTHDKLAAVHSWPLPYTQKHIKSLVHYSYYVDCIHHYFDGAATLNDLCHKNVLGNVVHTKVTKAAVEFLKARMISTLVLLISK
jgi:hypothetical protein